jgi:hypothetical protein
MLRDTYDMILQRQIMGLTVNGKEFCFCPQMQETATESFKHGYAVIWLIFLEAHFGCCPYQKMK